MHPTDEQLIGWALGEDDGTVGRHLAAACPECATRARRVQELLATLRADRDPDAPAVWISNARAIPGRLRIAKELLERVHRWARGLAEEAAAVVTDTAGELPAGVRAAGTARRLRFESADVELDLELEPAPGYVRVTGQFASLHPEPRPLASERFLLITSSGAWRDGVTDGLGEFDDRLEEAGNLQVRVVHAGKVVFFEVPEPRNPE